MRVSIARTLFDTDYIAIKKLIWGGVRQKDVATRYSVSQSHINKIVNGVHAEYVPWPDGSTGAIPEHMKIELKQHYKLQKLAQYNERAGLVAAQASNRFTKDGTPDVDGLYQGNGEPVGKLPAVFGEGEDKEEDGVMVQTDQWGATRKQVEGWAKEDAERAAMKEAEIAAQESALSEITRPRAQIAKDYNPDEDWLIHPELKEKQLAEMRGENIPPVLHPIPWAAVMAQEPDNAFVKEADASDDTAYKAALGELLRHVAASNWTTKLVEHNRALAARWLDSLPSKD